MTRMIDWGLAPLVLLGMCIAVQPARSQGLPKGDAILDKQLAATGGKEAYEKCKNRMATGTIEIASQGIKGQLTIYSAEPNKMYFEAEIPNIGKIVEAVNGDLAWSINPLTGTRLKQGAEKASALREADFNSELHWRKIYKKAECVGEETVEGKPCYKVQLTSNDDETQTHYIDQSSYLVHKVASTEKTPMGDIPQESFPSDYRRVDGILLPFKIHQKAAGQEINIVLTKVEHNAKLPDGCFDPPEEVKKLAEKEKKK